MTVEHNLLNGWFVWLFMGVLGCVAVFAATNIKDGAVERRKKEDMAAQERQ